MTMGKVFFSYACDPLRVWADQQGIDANLVDKNGKNAYIQAIESSGFPNEVKSLAKTKVDINMPDKDGKTPLMYGVEYHSLFT